MKYYQQQEHFGVMNNLLTLKLVSINLVELNLKIHYLRSKIFTTNLVKLIILIYYGVCVFNYVLPHTWFKYVKLNIQNYRLSLVCLFIFTRFVYSPNTTKKNWFQIYFRLLCNTSKNIMKVPGMDFLFIKVAGLTLSWPKSLLYRNQSTDL